MGPTRDSPLGTRCVRGRGPCTQLGRLSLFCYPSVPKSSSTMTVGKLTEHVARWLRTTAPPGAAEIANSKTVRLAVLSDTMPACSHLQDFAVSESVRYRQVPRWRTSKRLGLGQVWAQRGLPLAPRLFSFPFFSTAPQQHPLFSSLFSNFWRYFVGVQIVIVGFRISFLLPPRGRYFFFAALSRGTIRTA